MQRQGRWAIAGTDSFLSLRDSTPRIPPGIDSAWDQAAMKTLQLILTIGAAITTMALFSLCASSCHATRGLGHDMQHLGHQIEEEAAEHTRY